MNNISWNIQTKHQTSSTVWEYCARPAGILVSPVCKTPTQLVQLLSKVWHCSELWHLHHANWCVGISMWTSLCWCAEREDAFKSWRRVHKLKCVCVCVLERASDPVCCSLACGYLEVSVDVVSACRSGFNIFGLIKSWVHLADSATVGGRSFSLPSTFACLSSNIFLQIFTNVGTLNMKHITTLLTCEHISIPLVKALKRKHFYIDFTSSTTFHPKPGLTLRSG